jgi:hypothetical protein
MQGAQEEIQQFKQQEAVKQWAEQVIQIWLNKLAALRIGYGGHLENSFYYEILSAANGNVSRIEFVYKFYGKFVDMGAGPGVRSAKMWYSKTFLLEVRKLSNIMASMYAHRSAITIIENIDDNALRWPSQHKHI